MLRVALSWVLYWMGRAVSRLDNTIQSERFCLYRPYNKLMLASADVQGDDTRGPWKTVLEEGD